MKKKEEIRFKDLIPKASIELVNYSAKDLIDRLGKDIISNVVLSILCGDNIRNLTEGLTQRRLLLMNASLFITYLKALNSYKNFTKNLTPIISGELKKKLSANEKRYLYWFLGLTGKSLDNVVRGEQGISDYLTSLDNNLFDVSKEIEKQYGTLDIHVSNKGIEYLMNWPSLLRCMLALGAQTLTIRGSEKSMYGKLFEKFVRVDDKTTRTTRGTGLGLFIVRGLLQAMNGNIFIKSTENNEFYTYVVLPSEEV